MTLGELKYILSLTAQQFFNTLQAASKEYNKEKKNIEGRPITFKASGVDDIIRKLALFAGGALAVRSVSDEFRAFQTDLANVESLGVPNIEELKGSILSLAVETPVPIRDLNKGLYDVVSAGVDSANQIKVLDVTARGAKAGLAQTSDALTLGSAVIKSYGLEWDQTENILDKAFTTVKLGQTTFPEIAIEIQKVTPLASALGISVDELFGSFATLTGVTGNTAIVATQVRSIMSALAAPTAELTELIKSQGFASVESAVAQEGLAGIMKILQGATGGSAAAMDKFFGRVEASTAALALAGEQYETFVNKTEEVESSTGALNDAFSKQADTLDSRLQRLKNQFDVITIGLLDGSLPALNAVFDALGALVQGFAGLDRGTQQALIGIGAFTIALLKLPSIINSIRLGVIALRTSIGLSGGLITLLGLAAGAVAVFIDRAGDARTENLLLATSNRSLAESFEELKGRAYEAAEALNYEALTGRRDAIIEALAEEKKRLEELKKIAEKVYQTPEGPVSAGLFAPSEGTEKNIKDLEANLAAVNDRIAELDKKRTEDEVAEAVRLANIKKALTEKELADLDKLREYQYTTNRISLEDYIAYLSSRVDAQKQALGEQSVEYLRFIDNLNRLQNQLELDNLKAGAELDIRVPDNPLAPITDSFKTLFELQTDFENQVYSSLEAEYNLRLAYAEMNLQTAREYYGEESAEYKNATFERIILEKNFQSAKTQLARQGVQEARALGDQVINVFQGQNKTLFKVGKALSIANTTITAYEAIARAYKDYPFPVNIAISAIQGALAFAQVAKIKSTEFSGFASGTSAPLAQGDLIQSIFTPRGEDGIAALRFGEFIMSAEPTKKYLPILKLMQEQKFEIPTFSNGGQFGPVATASPSPTLSPEGAQGITREDLDEIIDAIKRIEPVYRVDFDFVRMYRETFPTYERLENERRVK